jgi:hypothetical protein
MSLVGDELCALMACENLSGNHAIAIYYLSGGAVAAHEI